MINRKLGGKMRQNNYEKEQQLQERLKTNGVNIDAT